MQDIDDWLRAYYAAWSTYEADRVLEYFAADAVFEDLALQARFEGLDGIRSFVLATWAGAPDFRVEPETIVTSAGGRRAAAAWTMSGTHTGDFPGLPATGKAFRVRASSFVEMDDGKIRRIVDYWNPLAVGNKVKPG